MTAGPSFVLDERRDQTDHGADADDEHVRVVSEEGIDDSASMGSAKRRASGASADIFPETKSSAPGRAAAIRRPISTP
jgi:hypothetical protein